MAPVYGFYAGNDASISATVSATTEDMRAAGKKYDPVTYEGAGHGFMRAGRDPQGSKPNHQANKRAREEAWQRWITLLKSM
jgi:carboxymethylenebutenolidase